jgi:hypothetical protein
VDNSEFLSIFWNYTKEWLEDLPCIDGNLDGKGVLG